MNEGTTREALKPNMMPANNKQSAGRFPVDESKGDYPHVPGCDKSVQQVLHPFLGESPEREPFF